MMWILYWDIARDVVTFGSGGGDREHLELIRAFNEVEPGMRQREILPEGRGVLYRAGETQVLWAFADFDHALGAACKVRDVRRGQDATLTVLPARRHGVYMIGGETDSSAVHAWLGAQVRGKPGEPANADSLRSPAPERTAP
jgi:hypothetical protein